MSTVFFKISDQLNKDVESFMKKEGYNSKAEFFRFLIKFYKIKEQSLEEKNFAKAARELAEVLQELKRKGKLTQTLDEQLADLEND